MEEMLRVGSEKDVRASLFVFPFAWVHERYNAVL